MADNIIDFEIQFKNAQASLRNVRKELEKELKDIKVAFDPKALQTLTRGSPSRVSAGAQGIKSGVTDRIESKLADTTKQLTDRQSKRASLLTRIFDTEKQIAAGNKGLVRTLSGLKGALTKEEKGILDLVQDQLRLSNALDNIAEVMESAGVIFARGAKGVEFRSLKTALKVAEEEAKLFADRTKKASLDNFKETAKGLGKPLPGVPTGIQDKGLALATEEVKKQLLRAGGLVADFAELLAPEAGKRMVEAENKYTFALKDAAKVARDEQAARLRLLRNLKKEADDKEKATSKDISKEQTRATKQVDKATVRANTAEKSGEASRAEAAFNERRRILEKANKDASRAAFRANKALEAGDTLKAEVLFNNRRKILEKANKDAEKAVQKADKALASGDADRQSFLLRKRTKFEQKSLEAAKRDAEEAVKRADAAEAKGIKSSAAAVSANEDAYVKSLRDNAAAAAAEAKTRINNLNKVKQAVEKEFAKKADAEDLYVAGLRINAKAINSEAKERIKLFKRAKRAAEAEVRAKEKAAQREEDKSLNKASSDVDRAFRVADKAVARGERDRAKFAERSFKQDQKELAIRDKIIKIQEDAERKLKEKLLDKGFTSPNQAESKTQGAVGKTFNTVIDALRPVASRLTQAFDAAAQRSAQVSPESLVAANKFYTDNLNKVNKDLLATQASGKQLSNSQRQVSEQLQRAVKTQERLRDNQFGIGSPNTPRRREAKNAARILGKQDELKALVDEDVRLTSVINKLKQQKLSIDTAVTGSETSLKGLLNKQVELQGKINNLKALEARAVQENITKEKAAQDQGIRGAIRRFAGGGGRGNAPPPSGPGGNAAGGDDGGFNRRITIGNSLLQKFRDNLGAGDRDALQFGQSIRRAANNLAAWATPSILVFKTISLLQDAVSQVIKLDVQVRRLVFFQAQDLNAFNTAMANSGEKAKLLAQGFTAIFNEADRTGLAINDVIEAANTVARIGATAFDLKTGAPSELLKATEALVKLEGGLISADRAAELLTSIMAQFNLESEASAQVVGAKLVAAANDAQLGLEGLGSAVVRFASAASDVQGLSLDQTLVLASEASKRLGVNASRTGTALKNLTTRIAERREEIEALTGIEIDVNETGQLKGKDALLEVLRALKSIKGTGAALQLGKLLGDQQNVADLLNLAGGVDEIERKLNELDDVGFLVKRSQQEVEASLNATQLQSESTESSLNRMNTAFVRLTESAGVKNIIKGLADTFTEFTNKAASVADFVDKATVSMQTLGAVATVVFANIAKKSLVGAIGLVGGKVTNELKRSVEDGLNRGFNVRQPTEQLEEKGIISKKQANNFIEQGVALEKERLTLNSRLAAQEKILVQQKKLGISAANEVFLTEQKIKTIQDQQYAIRLKDYQLRKKIANETTFGASVGRSLKENAGTLIGIGAQTLDFAFGDAIANNFEDPETKKAVRDGISNLATGATLGGVIGGLFGPVGAAIGASIGAGLSLVVPAVKGLLDGIVNISNFDLFGKETKRAKDLTNELEKINQKRKAERFAIESIDKRKREALETAAKQSDSQRKIIAINFEIEKVEARLARRQADKKDIAAEEAELRALINQRKNEEFKISKNEERVLAEKINLEKELALIKGSQQRFQSAISLSKTITDLVASEDQKIKLDVFFDKGQINAEIDSIRREINRRSKAIREIADDRQRDDERKGLEKQNFEDGERLIDLRFKAVEREIQGQREIFELAEKRLNTSLDYFRTIASELESAFQGLISAQEKILGLSRSNNDLGVRQIQARRSPNALATGIENTIGDRLTNQRLRASNNRGLVEDLSRELRNITNNGETQRAIVNNRVPRFSDIEAETEKLKKSIGDVVGQLPGTNGEFTKEQQIRREILNQDIASFKAKIEAERRNIDIDRDLANRRISINDEIIGAERERIEIEKENISILKEKAAREAELGERTLTDPQSVLQDLISGNFARQFLRGAGKDAIDTNRDGQIDSSERLRQVVVDLSGRISKLQGQAGGGTQLLEVLKGLEGLKKTGVDNVLGVPIDQVIESFKRLNGREGLDGVLASLEAEAVARANAKESAANIQDANRALIQSLEDLKNANNAEIDLEKRLRDIESEKLNILTLQNQQAKQDVSGKALREFNDVASKFTKTLGLFDNLVKITSNRIEGLSTGFTDLNVEIKELIAILESDRKTDANFDEGRPRPTKGGGKFDNTGANKDELNTIITRLASTIGESMTSAMGQLEEKLSNTTIRVEADLPALQIQFNGAVQTVINGDEFLAKLTEELRGSGLEDRVEEIRAIVLQLVSVEKARGTRLPPGF